MCSVILPKLPIGITWANNKNVTFLYDWIRKSDPKRSDIQRVGEREYGSLFGKVSILYYFFSEFDVLG
jgi:hypothetical protein